MKMEFKEITILSLEEFQKYEHLIPFIEKSYWLRSPACAQGWVTVVSERSYTALPYPYERINERCIIEEAPAFKRFKIRPSLRIELENNPFEPEDKLSLFGLIWTVLASKQNEVYVLCDSCVGQCFFNIGKGSKDTSASVWETSIIRARLEDWFNGGNPKPIPKTIREEVAVWINEHPGMSKSAIARALGMTVSHVCRAFKEMEARGET